ncbi:TrkA C-terminal domain-containing protein [Bacillus sp. NEB1478]|uniref:TrkA C-terminal domain-containing protein n=1 Tax=Bacillus sp. NEB1478 TaxID=3073816 RepID=UPI0028736B90|nr:TrkA C-terminal domain-containing protein [Bacillus sp. NEB1478]WNB93046.1 TrkA C-terminal domain-containing protein [Bacillus sp. NEB1478]
MGLLFTLLYFAIIAIVIEINVLLFTLTGLKKEVARFQVISMFTATGFTTGESELILGHPIRRRLSTFLILFGVFSLAVVISSISNILSNEFRSIELGIIFLVLVGIYIILTIPGLRKKLQKKFKKRLHKNYSLRDLPIREVLFMEENDIVLELPIHDNSSIIGKTLGDVTKQDDDLIALFIKRGDITIRKDASSTSIQEGDIVFLYGSEKEISNRFKDEMDELNNNNKD